MSDMTYDADDLPGAASWWDTYIDTRARDIGSLEAWKLTETYKVRQRALALAYYHKNRDSINAARRANRPSRAKPANTRYSSYVRRQAPARSGIVPTALASRSNP